jgi:hypothetical protein
LHVQSALDELVEQRAVLLPWVELNLGVPPSWSGMTHLFMDEPLEAEACAL